MKAQVLLPKVFNFSFTYNSNGISIKTGDFVEVPFGQGTAIGVVWKNQDTELKDIKIKNINKKIKNYSIEKNLINFVEWFSAYNMVPLGLTLKMSLGNKDNFIKNSDQSFKKTKKQKKYINLMMNKKKH